MWGLIFAFLTRWSQRCCYFHKRRAVCSFDHRASVSGALSKKQRRGVSCLQWQALQAKYTASQRTGQRNQSAPLAERPLPAPSLVRHQLRILQLTGFPITHLQGVFNDVDAITAKVVVVDLTTHRCLLLPCLEKALNYIRFLCLSWSEASKQVSLLRRVYRKPIWVRAAVFTFFGATVRDSPCDKRIVRFAGNRIVTSRRYRRKNRHIHKPQRQCRRQLRGYMHSWGCYWSTRLTQCVVDASPAIWVLCCP